MNQQKAFFPPRPPSQRGGRRWPQPSRKPECKPPVTIKNTEHGEDTPVPRPNAQRSTVNRKHREIPPTSPVVMSTPYSCNELLEALKSIQKVVQCCSCHKSLHSARTCTTGHGICYNCKSRCSKVCPICNSAILDSKPVMLNNLIKLLPRQCSYKEKGCDILILATDIDHEIYCRFRKVSCRFPSCATQCMAKELLRHLEDFHGKEIIRTASYSQTLMKFDANINKDGLAVIVAYNNIIWQHTKVGGNCLLQFYQYVPMEKPRMEFSVFVNFYTPERRYSATTPIHTDVFDPYQLFKDKETFRLPSEVASSFHDFYGGVHNTFEILKKEL